MINSSNQRLGKYTINVEFLLSSQDIINGNILNIPINISKTQTGTDNLFVGKTLTIFIGNKKLVGTYQQKLNNTEFLRIKNVSVFTTEAIQFNISSLFAYVEIPNTIVESIPLTLNDIKRALKPTKNSDGFKGFTGLLEPLHLEAIESIKFLREVSQKSISELLSYTTTIYYETTNNENNTQVQFGLFHSLFNAEFELKVFGSNFTIKTIRFGASEVLNNLNFNITINKILSNDSSKQIYQILVKLTNIPVATQGNVEKIRCYVNENLTNQNIFSTLPQNYNLSNSAIFISEKVFSRFILFYDNNGVVSLNPNESIKLTSNQNLNNITNFGWYHYDVLNVSDILLNNLPTKNVFYLNVKRLSQDLLIQYLYLYEPTKNVIKTYSRIRNNNTLLFSAWLEYVSSDHKHSATDITTSPTHQFVTQAQIDTWSNYANSISDYWNNAVATVANLPAIGINGESRLVLSNMKIYAFLTADNMWVPITDTKMYLIVTSDNVKLRINEGGVDKEITVPIVTNSNPGLLPSDVNSGNYKELFEQNLNFTPSTAGLDVPGSYQKQLEYTFNVLDSDSVKIYDGVRNYVLGVNGSLRTLDLTNLTTKINKTLYSVYSNQNIYSGVVTDFQFIIIPCHFITIKILFGSDRVINIIDENGISTVHTNPEYIIIYDSCEYIFKITETTINIYKFLK